MLTNGIHIIAVQSDSSIQSILVICQEEIEIIFTGISLKKGTLHPHSFLFLEKRISVRFGIQFGVQ